MDISEVPGFHLLRQMSSQTESQKLLQRLASHKLTAYLSVFDLIFNSMNYGHSLKNSVYLSVFDLFLTQ